MISEAVVAVGLLAGSFVATNCDNLTLLVSWLLASRGARRAVLAGHLLGMLALLLLSVGFGLGAELLPVRYIGALGVIPVALGLRGMYRLVQSARRGDEADRSGDAATGALAIAMTQVANGLDTILVLGPLLADSELGVDRLLISGFLGMALLWFVLARLLERQATRLRGVERFGKWAAPIILIGIGLYILADTATDVFIAPSPLQALDAQVFDSPKHRLHGGDRQRLTAHRHFGTAVSARAWLSYDSLLGHRAKELPIKFLDSLDVTPAFEGL